MIFVNIFRKNEKEDTCTWTDLPCSIALSDIWLTTRFSFQIALYLLVKQKEHLTLHQVSLGALFCALVLKCSKNAKFHRDLIQTWWNTRIQKLQFSQSKKCTACRQCVSVTLHFFAKIVQFKLLNNSQEWIRSQNFAFFVNLVWQIYPWTQFSMFKNNCKIIVLLFLRNYFVGDQK